MRDPDRQAEVMRRVNASMTHEGRSAAATLRWKRHREAKARRVA